MKTQTVYKTWAVMKPDGRVVRTFGSRDLAEDYGRKVSGLSVVRLRHVAEFVDSLAA